MIVETSVIMCAGCWPGIIYLSHSQVQLWILWTWFNCKWLRETKCRICGCSVNPRPEMCEMILIDHVKFISLEQLQILFNVNDILPVLLSTQTFMLIWCAGRLMFVVCMVPFLLKFRTWAIFKYCESFS
jgi:hypothetical protein